MVCAALVLCCVVLRFFTEVQSHVPEFDCLKSCDISPRISALEWWQFGSSHLTLLAANDRSVKVWRIESKQNQVDRQERQQRKGSMRTRAMQQRERQRQLTQCDTDATDSDLPSLWCRAASVNDLSGDEFSSRLFSLLRCVSRRAPVLHSQRVELRRRRHFPLS